LNKPEDQTHYQHGFGVSGEKMNTLQAMCNFMPVVINNYKAVQYAKPKLESRLQ
jgi:hypothetical protein